jgi:hypothetical protein
MIDDILWYTLVFIIIAIWYLYIFETLPNIRKHRTIYLRDWGFSAFQPLKNLFEYRTICEQEDKSLIWYKAQLYLLYSFIGIFLLSIVTLFALH